MKQSMKNSKMRILLAVAALTVSASALANTGTELPYQFKPDTSEQNLPSLQRGARDYMAYCSGCHSMKHMRYSRVAQDLKIPEELMKKHLMLTSDKIGDHILSAISPTDAAKWFGQAPPDLSVETRVRGSDWVYNYLMTFYVDPTRPNGVNNLVLKGVSMPHVLGDLQGWQVKPEEHKAAEGEHGEAAAEGHGEEHHGAPLELAVPGSMTPEEYRKTVTDITNFMTYAAEPGANARISTGIKVMLYLILLLVPVTYFLKKEFWKDVH
jgi:ubiquinol-cytochrome c reductase cytochrome c1 subunit